MKNHPTGARITHLVIDRQSGAVVDWAPTWHAADRRAEYLRKTTLRDYIVRGAK